jgi:hypothetical protein
MLLRAETIIALSLFLGLGISAVVLSIIILSCGRLYHRLSAEARPRRWVLISLLTLFAVFVISFPVWMLWPNFLISRILLFLFSITFFVVGITIKWLTPLVDGYIKRRGWNLR